MINQAPHSCVRDPLEKVVNPVYPLPEHSYTNMVNDMFSESIRRLGIQAYDVYDIKQDKATKEYRDLLAQKYLKDELELPLNAVERRKTWGGITSRSPAFIRRKSGQALAHLRKGLKASAHEALKINQHYPWDPKQFKSRRKSNVLKHRPHRFHTETPQKWMQPNLQGIFEHHHHGERPRSTPAGMLKGSEPDRVLGIRPSHLLRTSVSAQRANR